jgi:hypothetical protein
MGGIIGDMPKSRSLPELKRSLFGGGAGVSVDVPAVRGAQALAQEFGFPASHFTAATVATYERDAQRVFGVSFAELSAENRKNVVMGWIPFEKESGW